MKNIDLRTWPRRSHYEFFRGVAAPHFSITAPVQVERLVEQCRSLDCSVFNATLYAVTAAANEVAASFTVPIADDQFGFCNVRFDSHWPQFQRQCEAAIDQARQQTVLVDDVAHQDEWLYLSCLPWIDFTAMTNPFDGADDCIPRITWGRISRHGGRSEIPLAVQVHHALVDGAHVGQFFAALQAQLDRTLDVNA